MDKSRQQFEEWLLTQQRLNTVNMKFTFDGKEYFKDVSVNRLWLAWQASRESLINNLEPVGYITSSGIENIKEYGFTHINEESSNIINVPLYKLY